MSPYRESCPDRRTTLPMVSHRQYQGDLHITLYCCDSYKIMPTQFIYSAKSLWVKQYWETPSLLIREQLSANSLLNSEYKQVRVYNYENVWSRYWVGKTGMCVMVLCANMVTVCMDTFCHQLRAKKSCVTWSTGTKSQGIDFIIATADCGQYRHSRE